MVSATFASGAGLYILDIMDNFVNCYGMLVSNFVTELKAPYGGYNLPELFAYGWSVIGLGIIGALLFSRRPWNNKAIENFKDEDEEEMKEEVV